ncbi:hypothetical protein ABLE91_16215 [Aquabacter sp. CN5-332]|uniref:hypothetical protein n=1 Tax=Aquabacter sp. CN5-332 TaxID=3156608 RepID=UPI0032B379BB
MRKFGFAIAVAALLAGTSVYAGDDGAIAGGAAGAAAGAAVGGPVGAAVGAGVGATAGDAATGPDRERVIIDRRGDPDTTGSVNCSSRTVHRENGMGDSTTVKQQSCN